MGEFAHFSAVFFLKQNRKFGKRSNDSSKASTYGDSKAQKCISYAIYSTFWHMCRHYVCERPRTCMYSLWVLTEGGETMLRGWCVEACGATVPAYS